MLAPYLLALCLALRFGITYLVPNGTNFIDLHVYVDGAAAMDRGGLYDFVYRPVIPPLPLQFTYPPFAGLVFYPLHFLPFALVALGWQLGIVAALYGSAVLALKLLGRPDARMALAWTALAIWFEPVRHLFELGQVGALLMVAVLWAVYSQRWWLSGLLVGLAAGLKLTPAVAGLYFLGARRWRVVAFSAAVFAATVATSIAVGGAQARFYFTDLLGNADRVGVVESPMNQSLRGVIGLLTGHDAGYGPLVIVAVGVTALLSAAAWWRIGAEDPLGRIVVVMLFGLLVSPISWTHHWVWMLPLTMWLVLGSMRTRTRAVGWAWVALAYLGPPWVVTFTSHGDRPWYALVGGSLYVVATLATLAYVAAVSRRSD
ncbi:polyprenol-phosphate-mannose-dependent alpha-(1-2)-phosphatidylinositol pentamannoside mannosyltransferase [Mycobacterium antarcticum]|uniref:mannosyltransferase n=1 Tax=unclassified Mycolicibacterium TaxID=2636767 RepID=UPI0023995A7C|nr:MULTISPECIES: mannosyltransferase [unclassified Mycolicibacterium]BDX30776.1 polyprenol-phosphate-mannose-dependent alpha-(1-2)-phosphatidylinositol pentamannoside mannosyltransferase [Mycolicibacterium sp. TUM20985]GLP74140.1 polyprenol-phosphate-mannose-dependent alpha-(1-2)-phosphatidylinositol pentamannoside mannosyltransferase [Mycolicibacterium sp. TUM20983]GLP79924.1 polyprenol-phosphate-mannose-dependent alpha-(1-2)-phosphatidylinositol pentamannoside mannosyltransferase [Mycolicibact